MSDSGRSTRQSASGAGSGAVYALGIIGALVFFCSGPTPSGNTCSPCSRRTYGPRSWSTKRSGASGLIAAGQSL